MKWSLFLLVTAFIFTGCDTPDTPDYKIKVTALSAEYLAGDTITVRITNKGDASVFLAISDSLTNLIAYDLQQKSVTGWKTVSPAGTILPGKAVELPSDASLDYRFRIPFSSIPENGTTVFRVNHRIYLEASLSRQAGIQETATAPFFIKPL
ncbi:MAG: hypothetical protein HUU10_00735 [Bacteroidetes bacterium]|nr:hypothetical protein [Bacteroidota bacterium]